MFCNNAGSQFFHNVWLANGWPYSQEATAGRAARHPVVARPALSARRTGNRRRGCHPTCLARIHAARC